jgi:hypothetical protein
MSALSKRRHVAAAQIIDMVYGMFVGFSAGMIAAISLGILN